MAHAGKERGILASIPRRSTIPENMARLGGIEPPHPAPEAGALSPELQAPEDDGVSDGD